MKITPPNYTQAPNDLFDKWLPHLNESELKVLMVIIRKTFGWHKEFDRISISQLQRITGLCETSVLNGVKSLIVKGIIYKNTFGEIGKQQSFYGLVVEDSNISYPPSDLGGPPQIAGTTPPDSGDTKETNTKETIQKKQQQAAVSAAATNSNIQTKAKIYFCLEKVDIPDKIKCKLTSLYDENTIKNAIGWATHPQNPVKKSLAASITYACNERLSDKDYEIKKETPFERVKKFFENGRMYNQAECFLNAEEIGFQRGMKNHAIKFDKYFSWEKFEDLCNTFGIKMKENNEKIL